MGRRRVEGAGRAAERAEGGGPRPAGWEASERAGAEELMDIDRVLARALAPRRGAGPATGRPVGPDGTKSPSDRDPAAPRDGTGANASIASPKASQKRLKQTLRRAIYELRGLDDHRRGCRGGRGGGREGSG